MQVSGSSEGRPREITWLVGYFMVHHDKVWMLLHTFSWDIVGLLSNLALLQEWEYLWLLEDVEPMSQREKKKLIFKWMNETNKQKQKD